MEPTNVIAGGATWVVEKFAEHFVLKWITIVACGFLFPAIVYAFKWIFNNTTEPVMNPKKKKYFFGLGFVCTVLIFTLVGAVIQGINNSVALTAQQFGKALDKLNHPPAVSMEITGTTVSLYGADPKTHLISFGVRLFNAGSQSVTKDWELKVIGPDMATNSAIIIGGPYPQIWSFAQGGIMVTNRMDSESLITELTKTTPITEHGSQVGHIEFMLIGMTEQYMVDSASTFVLSFKDIYENQTKVAYKLPARN